MTKERLAKAYESGWDSLTTLYDEFEFYLETYYEIVAGIEQSLHLSGSKPNIILEEKGTGGLWELAKELTDEFQELHKDTVWNGEFFDEIEKFLKKKL